MSVYLDLNFEQLKASVILAGMTSADLFALLRTCDNWQRPVIVHILSTRGASEQVEAVLNGGKR